MLVTPGAGGERSFLGYVRSPGDYSVFTFSRLLSYVSSNKEGVFFEKNTGKLILQPVVRPFSLTTTPNLPGSVTHRALIGQDDTGLALTDGLWSDVYDSALKKTQVSQYSGYKDKAWAVETDQKVLQYADCFCVHLHVGAAHKDSLPDPVHTFRDVLFPSDAPVGALMWRASLTIGEEPRLYSSYDQGATWTFVGSIPSPVEMTAARFAKPFDVTLSFMQIDGGLLVWCGQDFSRFTLYATGNGYTSAGKVMVRGRNAPTKVGFSYIWFKSRGYLDTYPEPGPRGFMDLQPIAAINPKVDRSLGHGVTFRVLARDSYLREFTGRIELSAPDEGSNNPSDAGYSRTSPEVDTVTLAWPEVSSPPSRFGTRPLAKIVSIEEKESFSLESGILMRGGVIRLDNTAGQESYTAGLKAIDVLLGHTHTGLAKRGVYIAGTAQTMTEDDSYGEAAIVYTDLWFVLDRRQLRTDLYPSRWCVYSVVKFLLSQAGINRWLTVRIPGNCPIGPDPDGCPHTRFGAHPGWLAGQLVVPALVECRQVEQAWMGQDPDGYFRFEPFNFRPRGYKRIFREAATGAVGEELNEIMRPFARGRSLGKVRNDVVLGGWRQEDGTPFVRHFENAFTYQSKYDPSSPNYLGFAAPLIHLWSGYSTVPFMNYSGQTLLKRVPLPDETIDMFCPGQADLYAMDTIVAGLPRSSVSPSQYWITDMESKWAGPGEYWTKIHGEWTAMPGYPVPGR